MTPEVTHLLPGSIENIRQAVEGFAGVGSLTHFEKSLRQQWIESLLSHIGYEFLSKTEKGLVRKYIQNETGYSRAQTARLISASMSTIANRAKPLPEMRQSNDRRMGRMLTLATASMGVLLLFAVARPSNDLKFLNANVQKSLNVPLDPSVDPFDRSDPTFTHTVPMQTVVYSMVKDEKYPLYMQREDIAFSRGVAVAYEKIVATSTEDLLKRTERRRQMRALTASIAYKPSAPSTEVMEQVTGDRVLSLGSATVRQENAVTQIRGHAQDTRAGIMSDLFKRAADRRSVRLARVPEEDRYVSETAHAGAPVISAGPIFASAPNIWNAIGGGDNGQVLMVVDGTPQWTFINQTNVQSLPSGYISRRGGGSGRGGGGGGGGGSTGSAGADGATGATGATGADGADGPTLGIYNSLILESSGNLAAGNASGQNLFNLGLLTTSGALIVEGTTTLNSTVAINGVTYVFPSSDGSSSGKILATDSNGNLSWTADTDTNTT
ncbi:hypothetical protein CL635_00730, partial [bacterium]|nr:hypothetical protein [bacterium]